MASKEEAIDILMRMSTNHFYGHREQEAFKLAVEALSAEPERKKGKWMVRFVFEDCRYVKCDQCKVTQVLHSNKPLTNYCPNCGARMNLEDEVEE